MVRSRQKLKFNEPGTYRICVQGVLTNRWQDYVQGMVITIEHEENDKPITTLKGELADQAAVMGVLNILYNLRLPLISVDCISRVKLIYRI